MKYLSLFSGIEAASMAWKDFAEPVAFSEIEPFPCAVLAHHYPDVPNLGDVTQITEEDIKKLGTIDVVVGGPPCQAFSVAGLRNGLNDPRGNLTLEFMRIVDLASPRFVLWENVPGVLSDKTNAFEILLTGMGDLGYNIDTQVLDAQEFNLAQRRNRVFLVCEKRKYGQKRMSVISPVATVENLGKILLLTLGELSGLSQNTLKGSVLQDVSLRILPQMMRQLGMPSKALREEITWIAFWDPLLSSLEEALAASVCGQKNLGLPLGTNPGLRATTQGTDERIFVPMESELCGIGLLLKNSLVEVWRVQNASITSTWTSEMIALRTYSFVETVARIAKCISTLSKLPENLFVEDSLFLTAIRESMKYATKKNVKHLIKDTYADGGYSGTARNSPEEISRHFGDWQSRPPILLERESLRGDTPPSRGAGKGITHTITPSLTSSGRGVERAGDTRGQDPVIAVTGFHTTGAGYRQEGSGTLRARAQESHEHLVTQVPFDKQRLGQYGGGVSSTCAARDYKDASDLVCYALAGNTVGRSPKNEGNGTGFDDTGGYYTLTKTDIRAVAFSAGNSSASRDVGYTEEGTPPLRSAASGTNQVPTVAYRTNAAGQTMHQGEKTATLNTFTDPTAQFLHIGAQVRRLTPVECARLQGFPDTYLDISFRGKPAADGNKYKALGNSMAVPVMKWIGNRINLALLGEYSGEFNEAFI